MVHHVGHQLRAQLDRLLDVVDQREQALALDAHGMLAGGGVLRQVPWQAVKHPDASACSQCARPGAAEVVARAAPTRPQRARGSRHICTRRGEALAAGIGSPHRERCEPMRGASRPPYTRPPPSAARQRDANAVFATGPHASHTRATRTAESTTGQRMQALAGACTLPWSSNRLRWVLHHLATALSYPNSAHAACPAAARSMPRLIVQPEQSVDSVSPRWHGGCEVGQ